MNPTKTYARKQCITSLNDLTKCNNRVTYSKREHYFYRSSTCMQCCSLFGNVANK